MNMISVFHTLSALSGIAILAVGSLSLKRSLKRSLCCCSIS